MSSISQSARSSIPAYEMIDARVHGWELVFDERQDLLHLLRSLTPADWLTSSLCAGWRIKDVAAHLLVDEPVQSGATRRVMPMLAKQRFSVDRMNSWWINKNRERTPESIIESFEADNMRPIGLLGHLIGSAVALRALVIHHQDMRRPLHLTRDIPAERLLTVLESLQTRKGSVAIGSRARARGLHLRASDVSWAHGDGPEVSGPAEAIIMALAGRSVALVDLEGEGKSVLAARMP